MNPEEIKSRIPLNEIIFSTSRSGGPGGQNVNKVNTKVELRFNIRHTTCFSGLEKEMIEHSLKNRINSEGDLLIISQSGRSQLQNRKSAEEVLFRLVARALTTRPARKETKPTKASKTERLENKKRRSTIKSFRKNTDLSED